MTFYYLWTQLRRAFFNTTLFALLATALTLTTSLEAHAEVKPVPATEASNLIKLNTGEQAYTLVFVFTSWCPICKRNFPVLIDLAKQYEDKGVNVMAISADRSKSDLSNYIDNYAPLPFISYYAMQRFPGELKDGLKKAGIHYNGSVPFIALLDKEGNILGQGNYSVASVGKALHNLLPKN